MKKDYDYYVNRKNTPHLDLYTKLIGMFYFWNGMNFILGSVYALSIGQKKLVVSGLFLGILMCSLIKDKTTDKRKNQRDLKAVPGDVFFSKPGEVRNWDTSILQDGKNCIRIALAR